MNEIKIRSALISVYEKEGLEPIVRELDSLGVSLISTGGTRQYIEDLGFKVQSVEDLTAYPSILDGRVKTLHPKIFGGILARREPNHQLELGTYGIPQIDLVIVDLYPFEETLAQTNDESTIIEKIDIGGISLIRAGAKNYKDVWTVSSRAQYQRVLSILGESRGTVSLEERKYFAAEAFGLSSHYDTAIFEYFARGVEVEGFRMSVDGTMPLRYGENPHQSATFYGDVGRLFDKLGGKDLSFNNLVDIDAAVQLMREFKEEEPTIAILKHTNPCGVASRISVLEAWKAALAGDPVSAFGGIIISNTIIDEETAKAIDEIFYEVLIAPEFEATALAVLQKKRNRVQLRLKSFGDYDKTYKHLLGGIAVQEVDKKIGGEDKIELVTRKGIGQETKEDLLFGNKCVKHLKSNAIALVKNKQLIGMGSGQTSRVDAVRQAIAKAASMGFNPEGAVLASDAFFPFADSVQLACEAGIVAVIQPGGSVRDQESIDFCDAHDMAMVTTGIRHFRH